jgi:LPS export ABC transporter protein LptC
VIAEQYLLAAGCLVAALTALQPRTQPVTPAATEVDAAADQHIVAATLTRWNPAGGIAHELTAARLDYPGGDRALLTGPRLRLGAAPHGGWLVRAESGYLADEVVELDRHVAAEIEPAGGTLLRLHTDHLTVDPTANRAWSDRAVRIETRHSELRGRGMQADLANGRVQLLAAVRGAHEPKTD